MKRRDFLKILGIAPAVAAVPTLAKTNNTDDLIRGEYDVSCDVDTVFYGESIVSKIKRSYKQEIIAKLNGARIPLDDCLTNHGGLTAPKYAAPMDSVTFTTGWVKLK